MAESDDVTTKLLTDYDAWVSSNPSGTTQAFIRQNNVGAIMALKLNTALKKRQANAILAPLEKGK